MLNFNKESHQYFLNKKELTSVSQVMQQVGVTKPLPEIPVIMEAAAYGTSKHNMLAGAISNPFFEVEDLDHEDKEHYNFYAEIVEGLKLTDIEAEKIVYNEEWKIAGTADIVATGNDGRLTVIDHKFTSRFYPYHLWQACIYALLIDENAAVNANCYVINYKTKQFYNATNEDFKMASKIIATFLCGEKMPEKGISEDLQHEYRKRKVELDLATARLEEIKLQIMEEVGSGSVKSEMISVTYKKGSKRRSFNSEKVEAFLKQYLTEEELQSCYKTSIISPSYTFKIIGEE